MQIVIDVDENLFTRLFDNGTEDYGIGNDDVFAMAKSIRKGTPLPKGHGDLYNYNDLSKLVGEDFRFFLSRLDLYLPQPIIKADTKSAVHEALKRMGRTDLISPCERA